MEAGIPTLASLSGWWSHVLDSRSARTGTGLEDPHYDGALTWDAAINQIVAMQHLGENWDGLGAVPPPSELLTCAAGLAIVLKEDGVPSPDRVVASTAGTVILEWQFGEEGYGEVEIDRLFHADVMYIEAGKPAKHWELPNA
jgi:hypothetical protein